MLLDYQLLSMFEEAKALASETGEVWCKDIHNSCKSICFCLQLERCWEKVSKHPLPPMLQLERNKRLQASTATQQLQQASPASEHSGVYSEKVSYWYENAVLCSQYFCIICFDGNCLHELIHAYAS